MQKFYFYILLLSAFTITASKIIAQDTIKAPDIVWQKTIGGNDEDAAMSLKVFTKKAFIVSGYTKSGASGNKSDSSFGGYDFWVVKMDAAGNVLWNKTFGGNKDDFNASIIDTKDGGFLVGGTSNSDSSGSKSDTCLWHSNDYWVIKLDKDGNKMWDRTIGGVFNDVMTSLTELPNGAYVVGGYSYSDASGAKRSNNLGAQNNADYWIAILTKDGQLQAQNSFGGTSHDVLTNVAPAAQGGVISAGYSYSIKLGGHKADASVGNCDDWIVRSDDNGNIMYQGNFGGDRSDYLTSMQSFRDSSIMLGGYSNSSASFSKTQGFLGNTDYWIVKVNPDGTKGWDKTYGSSLGDYLVSVQQTYDHGYILGGYSNSNKGTDKTEDSRGGYDYWIVKTDSMGNVQWDKTIGGTGDDKLTGVYEIDQDEYIVAGTSNSGKSGDKDTSIIGTSGASDFWIMRLGKIIPPPPPPPIDTTPPPPPPVDTTVEPPVKIITTLQVINNPASNTLSIKYNTETDGKADFVIYSVDGKAVLKTTLPATTATSSHQFNIAGLPRGVYYLVMYTGSNHQKMTRLIMKE